MLLRRHKRTPDLVPKVNGKIIKNPPKEKSLNTAKTTTTTNIDKLLDKQLGA